MAGDEERWQEWFSLADEALYRAKNCGRDSSVIAGLPVPAAEQPARPVPEHVP
jgi:hypothetical protein